MPALASVPDLLSCLNLTQTNSAKNLKLENQILSLSKVFLIYCSL